MIPAPSPRHCTICQARSDDEEIEAQRVRSNVRAFRHETFEVWRCAECLSLHAAEAVDLEHYYAHYPFHALTLDARLRLLYSNQRARLRRAGVQRGDTILDYGAGAGHFVRHLQAAGFPNTVGYDAYCESFRDPSALNRRYRCVVSQDVLEHVPDPNALLDTFHDLVEPDGIIAIGTPNASAIALERAERYVHALHLPYHRHIFSKPALLAAAQRRGWTLERYYPSQYANTGMPFLNSKFYSYYMKLFDDTLDALLEPPRVVPLLARLPLTLFWALFGRFLHEETDVMFVFRRN
jgi:2-polyprenyl-3-methyl-5-hydroxy-6-metoxy-1,4-benzoquinol methylase